MIEFWVLPAVLGQPWLRLYLMAEHTGCPLIPDMLANSRTTLTNPVVRFFAWNMPYHAEHHSFPAVPFHALPALHADLAPALKTTARGYVAAQREIFRALAEPRPARLFLERRRHVKDPGAEGRGKGRQFAGQDPALLDRRQMAARTRRPALPGPAAPDGR